ncbi:MAG: L,D-transpeptidase [Pseudomonadota bacterium]
MFRVALAVMAAIFAVSLFADDADARKRKWKKKRYSYKARVVNIKLGMPVGTVVIVNNERRLYYVLSDKKAKRFRVAVGERIELWTGRTFISGKKEDPDWHPVDGSPPIMGGRPGNPLGKMALYLDWGLLRIHGTPNRRSVGSAVSNGCIRMYNEDVLELAQRAHVGTPVIAVNRRRDLWRFKKTKFTGKLPAWPGQAQLWKERARKAREEKRAARRGGTRRNAAARRSGTRRSNTQRSRNSRWRSASRTNRRSY